MLVQETIYIRLRNRIKVSLGSCICAGDLSQIKTNNIELKNQLEKVSIHQVKKSDQNFIIIDIMQVIDTIQRLFPSIEIQTIGPCQTIVEVIYKKKTMKLALFIVVWLLLFVGSGLAIMNFHEDVSMRAVHQNIYYMITGREEIMPLLLQIPYSFGLGIGMILFFNHLFRKRLNEEPSPLEIEMFKYQQDLDQYVIMNENKESMKTIDND